eukprot:TRINITY_DN4299_c0_g1_i1.p1 TRINITY_DN4299_c0_g1~~TRINITY_DN4299_c0_g1_i1.p1  ORF type:complete len:346 (-),score=85.27 TRINITY_DN4299_c0_g1_i1:61-1098(-)
MEEFKQKYEVERLLANGTSCSVYLVKDRKKGHHCVAKYMQKSLTSSPAYSSQERRFKNQTKILKTIQNNTHSNICKIKEFIEDEASLLVVQDYVGGGTLLEWVCRNAHKKNREEKVRKMFWKILTAVDFLHNNLWIIHRDLKLENILLDKNKEPKLIDFNLSASWSKEKLIHSEFCGSLLYCAPEILKKKPYRGPEQDIWSLGVVLYVLLYTYFPFHPDEEEEEEVEENEATLFPFEEETEEIEALKKEKEQQKMEIRVEVAKKIIEGQFHTPSTISASAINLIRSILLPNPKKRPSIAEIKAHPWFERERSEEKRIRSPPFLTPQDSKRLLERERERREKVNIF